MRLRTAVTSAIKHWTKEDVEEHVKIISLRKDIINGPCHIFGDHTNCREYFCKKAIETNYIPEMTTSGMYKVSFCRCFQNQWWSGLFLLMTLVYHNKNITHFFLQEIQRAANTVAHKTESLLFDTDNNKVESFNSVIAKFIGGKRVNFCKRNSYQMRCEAAVVSFNSSGEFFRKLHKKEILKVRGPYIWIIESNTCTVNLIQSNFVSPF